MVTSAMLVAQVVGGKALRDAVFLTHFGVALLPQAMIAGAVISAVSVLVMTRALSVFGPARAVPTGFLASSLLLLCACGLDIRSERDGAIALYVHSAIFNQALGSAFWSLINERLDPHRAKRLVGRITSAGTAGGVLAGLLLWGASGRLSVTTMLVLLATVNAVGAWGAARLAPRASKTTRSPATPRAGFEVVAETAYLRNLAVLVAVGAMTQALLDWLLSAQAAHRWQARELVTFFAVFSTAVSVLSFIAQALFTRTLLEKRGLGGTIKLPPMSVATATLVALVVPVFFTVVVTRVIEQVTRSSLYRSAYELFYTPLPAARKRPAKMLIDVGVDRVGTALGSACIFLVVGVGSNLSASEQLELQTRVVLLGVLALTTVAIYVPSRLQAGYVLALAASLRSGAIDLEDRDVEDLTTRKTLAETSTHLDRAKLLAGIEELRLRATNLEQPPSAEAPAPDEGPRDASSDELLTTARALRSEDEGVVRRALQGPLSPSLVAFVIPLLSREELARDATRALREVARTSTGTLLDYLLDAGNAWRVRQRIPRVLKSARTPRAVSGLLLALEDPIFEIRAEVALTLSELTDDPNLPLSAEAVLRLVRRELTVGRTSWPTSRVDMSDDVIEANRRGIAHVFVMLGTVLDREPLMIAHRACRGEDPSLRGTAIEYLDVVLPADVRDLLLPLLGHTALPRPGARRGAQQVAAELLKSRS